MTIEKQPKGLGDLIENITKATGIKKLVDWAFGGIDCGCDARKEKLNKLFPRKQNPECLNEQEYKYLKEIELDKFGGHTKIGADKQRKILSLNVSKWGIVSAVANFASVVFQLYRTMKTQKVKSFSMKFISLMTFLNFVYVIIGILTENYGMTFACLVFVVYNLIIVYYYYFGKSE
jgi:uncharacterized protein with PQ loop repeat